MNVNLEGWCFFFRFYPISSICVTLLHSCDFKIFMYITLFMIFDFIQGILLPVSGLGKIQKVHL